MNAPRIDPVDPPYAAAVQADFDTVMRGAPPLLLFRTVARNPRVLQRMMAGGLLDKGSISMRARELVILRTCALCKAEYEWGVHVAGFGPKLQWSAAELHSTVHGDANDPCWTGPDRLLMAATDQLHQTSSIDETLWTQLATHFAPDQLIEIVMLAGLYHAVSYMVNACRIGNETFGATFPPAGAAQ